MNEVQLKNNMYKAGVSRSRVDAIVKEKGRNVIPTNKQVQFRDALYNFLKEKGIIKPNFRLERSRRGIHSNINALKTILYKHGLDDEFYTKKDADDGQTES